MTTKTTTPKLLQRDTTNGQQSLLLKSIWEVGGHRLRITRKRNAYAFQSHACIKRWNGEEWRAVESIPYEAMAKHGDDSYVTRSTVRPNPAEIADELELLRRAGLVLDFTPKTPRAKRVGRDRGMHPIVRSSK